MAVHNTNIPSAKPIAPWFTRLILLSLFVMIAAAAYFDFYLPKSKLLLGNNASATEMQAYLKDLQRDQAVALIDKNKKLQIAEPLDLLPLINLAILNENVGDKALSENYVMTLARRTLQEKPIQIAALNLFLTKNDYAASLRVLDALTRIDGKNYRLYAAEIAKLAETDEGRIAIAKHFAAHPRWRRDFVNFLANDPARDPNQLYRVFGAFQSVKSPPTRLETQSLLRRLVGDGNYDKAYFVWLDSLNEAELRKVDGIFDGNFEFDFGDRYFDWTVVPVENAEVATLARDDKGTERSLVVSFASARTNFRHISQMLKLAPGDYNFTGESKVDNLLNERGLTWRVYCFPNPTQPILSSKAFKGTEPWSPFAGQFTVPSTLCETQVLRLEMVAVVVADTQISGRVAFDKLRVERQPGQP